MVKDKHSDKALDKSIENEDIRSILKSTEQELADRTIENSKLQQENRSLKSELEWMVDTYNNAIEAIYDKIDDYAHLVKRSRLKYLVAERDRQRNAEMNMEKVENPPTGYQK